MVTNHLRIDRVVQHDIISDFREPDNTTIPKVASVINIFLDFHRIRMDNLYQSYKQFGYI